MHEGAVAPVVHVISYDRTTLEEGQVSGVEEVRAVLGRDRAAGRVTWIDVQGLGNPELLRSIAEVLELHPLAVADAVNVGQRPKVDAYPEFLYCAIRMVMSAEHMARWEQVSVFVGHGFVLTVQETIGDCLDPLRERLRQGRKALRGAGADFLGCMLIDAIVDGYFPVLEEFGEDLEELEERVIESADGQVLGEVYRAKRDLMSFRRAVWPLRDTLSQLLRDPHPLLSEASLPYLRDTTDHAMQVVDVVETYRELAASFVDVYLTSVANRTNDVMRVLTVIGSIFLPLTFLSGIYGMNFDTSRPLNMPELGWRFGYVGFWVAAAAITTVLLLMFNWLGWLGRPGRRRRRRREDG